MVDILMIVPSRSRPQNVRRLLDAWSDTGAWGVADLRFDIDLDDPQHGAYLEVIGNFGQEDHLTSTTWNQWRPMVHKLNRAAQQSVDQYAFLGFMGDDHCPETVGWAQRWLDILSGGQGGHYGIVYGRDGYQDAKLPTYWLMSSGIVKALGRMVPARVEHLYCDNSILDLGKSADCILYDPEVTIRHRHFTNKMAAKDDQYRRVNSREQFARDRRAYDQWRRVEMSRQAAVVRQLFQ